MSDALIKNAPEPQAGSNILISFKICNAFLISFLLLEAAKYSKELYLLSSLSSKKGIIELFEI